MKIFNMKLKNLLPLFLISVMVFAACKKNDAPMETLVTGPNLTVYGISSSNELVKFNSATPGVTTSKNAITGIVAGEKLLSIDFRPATGELYALSDASKLYIINTTNFSSRVVSAVAFTPAISGAIVSIDFNPTVDRLRLVTNTGQNLRLNPETGTVAATDGNINGGTSPAITGVAYTNSKAGASATELIDIDFATGKVYTQNPPNNGTLVERGSLGFTFTGQSAFDISGDNTAALLAATVNGNNALFIVNLTTGMASKIGNMQDKIIDLAIPTETVAYATDASNNLLIFNPEATTPTIITKAITGLQAAENIYGIDFRPLNGQLYALGSSSRLYTLNLSSGVATQVGTTTFATLLAGTDFGFDFNPTVDRIRVVSNTGQNLRLNPIDGTIAATDAALNPGTPMVTAAAYTNNFSGATTTQLFVIDHNADKLYEQIPPNNGTLVEKGSLGIDISSSNGFDIGSISGKAYLIATVGGVNKVYSVNTTTGAATAMGSLTVATRGFSMGTGF